MDIPLGSSRERPDEQSSSRSSPLTGQAVIEEGLSRDCGTDNAPLAREELEAPIDPSAYCDAFYSFLHLDHEGRPITWFGTRHISVLADPTGSDYDSFLDDVRHAVDQIALASGFNLRFEGTLTPGLELPEGQVVIRWVTPAELTQECASNAVAGTVATWRYLRDRPMLISATIRLRRHQRGKSAGFVPYGWGVVLLHELGHSLGLGHCRDVRQVMSGTTSGMTQLGWGDRLGLQLLREAAL